MILPRILSGQDRLNRSSNNKPFVFQLALVLFVRRKVNQTQNVSQLQQNWLSRRVKGLVQSTRQVRTQQTIFR